MLTGSEQTRPGFPIAWILGASALVFCAVVALVFFFFDPTKVAIFPPCYFHLITGLDCPGCGAQRALHQLLHGNLIAAIRLNAMFVLSLPLALWFGPRLISNVLKREPISLPSRWLWVYLAAWGFFGLLRNLPFPVCAWFAA